MAAGDLLGKRQGAVGLGYEATPGTPLGVPTYMIPCESANIESTPTVYEAVNNLSADPVGIESSGSERSWSFSNSELDIETIGYLMWLWAGYDDSDGITTDHPWDTSLYDSKHLTFFKDHGGEFEAGKSVEILDTCRIESLTIDQQEKSYAKVSASGVGAGLTYSNTPLDRNLNLGDNNSPLSWLGLMDALAYIKIGTNEGATAKMTHFKSLKLELGREVTRAGANLLTDDPRAIIEGARKVMWEVTFDLRDQHADASTVLAAVRNGDRMALEVRWETPGVPYLTYNIKTARVTNSPKGELGTGSEPQIVTIQATAFKFDAANHLIEGVNYDNVTSTYATRVGS